VNEVREIADAYLDRVKSSGSENIMAICPFHRKADGSYERNPSFAMNTSSGLWFCHSCKSHGNLRTFLSSLGVSPLIIDRRYKAVIEEVARHRPRPPDHLRPKLLSDDPLPESLLGIFDKCPVALEEEGFSDETMQAFDVGFDDLHMRITYPLRDLSGSLIGISGRTVIDENPRYKTYDDEYHAWDLPARTLDKRTVLWNIHELYPSALFGGLESITLVEGFKACMWLWQAGIKTVAALLGSYMSTEQQWILEHMGVPVYLMLDNNAAGEKGRDYIAPILAKSLSVRIVEYEEEQPSDVPPDQVLPAISQAKDYYLWAIERQEHHGIR
jgi:DNA primase